jgi:hypothetical protein
MTEGLIRMSRRIRPLRIGYTVNPVSDRDVARAIETATSQWGGKFQPFIPAFRRRPSWWKSGPFPLMGPVAIEKAYRDAFACDFLVMPVQRHPTT